jgi:hypothetical protein
MTTDKQQAFALEYASNGANATAAAKAAGYSEKSAHEIGRQLLEISHVQEAIHRELMRNRYRSGAIGLEAMIQIATNEKAPAAARVSAARALMEHGGLLGTAKEMDEARANADSKDSIRPVDYKEILQELGRLNRGNPCPATH